jgi:hypothetical protein
VTPFERPVRVVVVGTEIECCMPPPELGDVVSWPLMMFVGPEDGPNEPPDALRDRRRWRVEHWNDGATVLVDGGLHVYWAPHGSRPPSTESSEVAGHLVATLHHPTPPEALPATTGRVARLWVTYHQYREQGRERRYLEQMRTSATLREVERSPQRFGDSLEDGARADGMLVELRVAS